MMLENAAWFVAGFVTCWALSKALFFYLANKAPAVVLAEQLKAVAKARGEYDGGK
jgi:hypothetical protein